MISARQASKRRNLLRRLNQEELPAGDHVHVELIETTSECAVALAPDWFAGEHDKRWRLNANGYDEHVRGPRRS